MNALYYGDNLEILRKYIKDESVDLIYLAPPFNSQRAYNVIFPDKTGKFSTLYLTQRVSSMTVAAECTMRWPSIAADVEICGIVQCIG